MPPPFCALFESSVLSISVTVIGPPQQVLLIAPPAELAVLPVIVLRSTVSVLYFMYEEGFRWWNLGFASAVAFVLFVVIFAVSAALWRFDRDPEGR